MLRRFLNPIPMPAPSNIQKVGSPVSRIDIKLVSEEQPTQLREHHLKRNRPIQQFHRQIHDVQLNGDGDGPQEERFAVA